MELESTAFPRHTVGFNDQQNIDISELNDESALELNREMYSKMIVCTPEENQEYIDTFRHHVESCREPFTEDVLRKVLELKGADTALLQQSVIPSR